MLNLNKFFHQSFEKVAEKFFRKIQYGNLRVSFPSGEIFCFKGKNQGINADIKLNNFLIIPHYHLEIQNNHPLQMN